MIFIYICKLLINTMTNIYKTCLELIEQRNYKLKSDEKKDDEHIILAEKPNGHTFCIILSNIEKFNIAAFTHYSVRLKNESINHVLITYKLSSTSAVKKAVEKMGSNSFLNNGIMEFIQFELFAEKDLQYNITKHVLQPKFEKLDEKESVVFKHKWSLFGVMALNDPVSRFFNYKIGDVIRIRRKNNIYYRIVKKI